MPEINKSITTDILNNKNMYIKYKNKFRDTVWKYKMKEMLNLICVYDDAAVQNSHHCWKQYHLHFWAHCSVDSG